MKTCPKCGKEFRNLGAHMKAHRGDDVQERAQETSEEARPQRPLERFGRVVFGGDVRMFRR